MPRFKVLIFKVVTGNKNMLSFLDLINNKSHKIQLEKNIMHIRYVFIKT